MSSTLHRIILTCACIACISHGRRVQSDEGQVQSNVVSGRQAEGETKFLAAFLQRVASPPGFHPSAPGLKTFRGPGLVSSRRLALDRQTDFQRHIASLSMSADSATRSATWPRRKFLKLRRNVRAATQNVTRMVGISTNIAVALLASQESALAESGTLAFDALPLLKKNWKLGVYAGGIGLAVFVVIKVRQALKWKNRFQKEMKELETMLMPDEDDPFAALEREFAKPLSEAAKTEPKLAEDKYDFKVAAPDSVAAPVATSVAIPVAEEKRPTPAPAPAVAPKKRGLQALLSKPKKVKRLTLAELMEGHSDKAALCRTLEWALRVPVEVDRLVSFHTADSTAPKDSAEALALKVAEELTVVFEEAIQRGMEQAEMARAVEDMGCAMLLEYVDAAVDALDKPAEVLEEASVVLCRFVHNANYCAKALGVEGDMNDVVYEGKVKTRKLEQLYTECLSIAMGDMGAMGAMGDMGAIENVADRLSQVEQLWPLFKFRRRQAERLLRELVEKKTKMSESDIFPPGLGKGEDGAGEVPSKEQFKQYAEYVAGAIDSGMMPQEEIENMKKSFSDQLGMPVEEFLENKDELRRVLPEEDVAMLDIAERLFDPKNKPPDIDESMQFSIKKPKS